MSGISSVVSCAFFEAHLWVRYSHRVPVEEKYLRWLAGFMMMMMMMMMMALFSRANIFGDCSTIRSPPALFFQVEISWRTKIPLCLAKDSPQWLSELKRLWPSVPSRVACELVSCLFTLYLHSGIVSPVRPRRVKGVCEFRCSLPPALLAE